MKDSGWSDVLFPLAWIAIVSAIAVASRAIANDRALLTVLALLAALGGGLWAGEFDRPWEWQHAQ